MAGIHLPPHSRGPLRNPFVAHAALARSANPGSFLILANDNQPAQGCDDSEATAAQIDQEVEHLIAERQEVVRQLPALAHAHLDTLAEALLTDETMREDALVRMLGARTAPLPLVAQRG